MTSKLVLGFEPGLHDASFDVPEGPLFSIDYVDIVDPETFERAWEPTPESLIVAAARLKDVRLIDNLVIGPITERRPDARRPVHPTDHDRHRPHERPGGRDPSAGADHREGRVTPWRQ